jgi:hypothetical protein
MERAVDIDEWRLDYAQHWLAVAREIREAAMWGAIDALPQVPSLEDARNASPATTRDSSPEYTQRLEDRLHIPLPEDAATQVMGALRNCYHCGQTIAYDESVAAWRHVASQQRICAIPGDDDTAVHAWPGATLAG